ncbi:hypothetical protein IVB30_06410 [Bradyrhizobium sp. 200]|uniref:hypothetical protein n=1 Tax=Bradyrhizobium sp. 200 TaxID=2782665 RepID=UPI001FFF50CC|nr:hypothetical protein [Bradyrhizobium sp. 200]UPJ50994.1 hypothetical protein IVB30_06410 [Bradyrhizobium sp. 200]
MRRPHQTLRQIFAAPLAIGILSVVGLLAALIGDNVWDAVSWISLAIPCVLYVFFIYRRAPN